MAVILVAAFVAASVFRSQGLFIHDIYRAQEFLGGDHASHFLMGAAFMGAGLLIAVPRSMGRVIFSLLFVYIMLVLEEFSQIWIPTREFSLADLKMGIGGASTTILCHVLCFAAFRAD